MGQWLSIHLPMKGPWVRSLVWEDVTCCGILGDMYQPKPTGICMHYNQKTKPHGLPSKIRPLLNIIVSKYKIQSEGQDQILIGIASIIKRSNK